ncbi:transposase [Streptomyces sp. NPDC093675]|uniref:transposase n=1 Tax=Streptomyces sp. NPDC093675 TaxID=3366049 RepID=UPI0038172722
MDTEGHGIPLAVALTGGNRNNVTQLIPLAQAFPPVRGRRWRPRQRPVALHADRGYDHDRCRKQVQAPGVIPSSPPRHRPRLRSERPPMGRRSELRTAALVPSATHPMGDPRRRPRSAPLAWPAVVARLDRLAQGVHATGGSALRMMHLRHITNTSGWALLWCSRLAHSQQLRRPLCGSPQL